MNDRWHDGTLLGRASATGETTSPVLRPRHDHSVPAGADPVVACDPALWKGVPEKHQCPACNHNLKMLQQIKLFGGAGPEAANLISDHKCQCDWGRVGLPGEHWQLVKVFVKNMGKGSRAKNAEDHFAVDSLYNAIQFCAHARETGDIKAASDLAASLEALGTMRNDLVMHPKGDDAEPAMVKTEDEVFALEKVVHKVLEQLELLVERVEANLGPVDSADRTRCEQVIETARRDAHLVASRKARDLIKAEENRLAVQAALGSLLDDLRASNRDPEKKWERLFARELPGLFTAVQEVGDKVDKVGDKVDETNAVLGRVDVKASVLVKEVQEMKTEFADLKAVIAANAAQNSHPDLSNGPVVGVFEYAVERTAVQARIRDWVQDEALRPVLMVEGPPGIGKSSAVTKAALELRDRFSFVRFMDGRSLSSLHESVLRLAVRAKVASRTDKIDKALIDEVLAYLGEHARETGKPYLIVVEDASGLAAPDRPDLAGEAEEARELVLKLAWGRSDGEIPGTKPAGLVLGTVWSSSVFRKGEVVSVPVDLFSEVESLEVLGKLHPVGKGSDGHVAIARALGHYPLAVSQAGHLLSMHEKAGSADKFAERILKDVAESPETAKKTSGGHVYFGATCKLAIEVAQGLSKEQWEGVVEPLLELLSALDGPGGIEDGMIERWLMRKSGAADGDEYEAEKLSSFAVDEVLVPAGLVVRGSGTVTMHRLFQDVVWRRASSASGASGQAAALEAAASLLSNAGDEYRSTNFDDFKAFSLPIGHFSRVLELAALRFPVLTSDGPWLVLCKASSFAGAIMRDRFLNVAAAETFFHQAISYGEVGMERAQDRVVAGLALAWAHNGLGWLLKKKRAVSLQCDAIALEILEAVLPPSDKRVLESRHRVAQAHLRLWHFEEAVAEEERVLDGYLGVNALEDAAHSLSYLAHIHSSCCLPGAKVSPERKKAAPQVVRSVVARADATISSLGDSITNVKSLMICARSLRTMHPDDAYTFACKAAVMLGRAMSPPSPMPAPAPSTKIADFYHDAAKIIKKKDLPFALTLAEKALKIRKELLPANHENIKESEEFIQSVSTGTGDIGPTPSTPAPRPFARAPDDEEEVARTPNL